MKTTQSDDRSQMNVLDAEECLVLLRWEIIGRLGVSIPGHAPSIVPVNFVMDNNTVVFRTAKGEKYDQLVGHPVSLEVDRFDWFRRTGWSVLVQGVAEECSEDEVAGLELSPWAPGDKPSVIRIVPTTVTGRRIELTTPATDPRLQVIERRRAAATGQASLEEGRTPAPAGSARSPRHHLGPRLAAGARPSA